MNVADVVAEIERIRDRVRNNVPRHHRPEAFHEEKSEITCDLTALAAAIQGGQFTRDR